MKKIICGLLFFFLFDCTFLDANEPGNLVPKTVSQDSTLPSMEINGTLLHLETFGNPNSNLMIFLHGGPGEGYLNYYPYTNYSDQYYIILWDQRSSGLSEREKFSSSEQLVNIYLEDLNKLIEHFRISNNQKVICIGHSWGGQYLAWYLNKYHPPDIQCVMADPGPLTSELYRNMGLTSEVSTEGLSDYLQSYDLITPDNHERLDYQLLLGDAISGNPAGYHLADPNSYRQWDKIHLRIGGMIMLRFQLSGESFDYTENLTDVTNRIIFLRSELNEYHDEQYMTTYTNYFSNANRTYITIPDVGHDFHLVKITNYMQAILTNIH